MLTDLEIKAQVTCGILRLICLRSGGKEDEWDGRDRGDSKEAG
jgi:hypothetical protein